VGAAVVNTMPSTPNLLARDDGPAVEHELAAFAVRRLALVAPIAVAVAAIPWGVAGALSAAYALVIVTVNLLLSAGLLAWAARTSFSLVMAVALFGYILRLGLITAAVLAVRNQDWVELLPLGLTLIVAHLGVLFWEARHVSASLAFPALKPGRKG
jgi:hypothetical protein